MNGPVKAAWLDALEKDGLQIVQYIHPFTYVVWGEANARDVAAQRSNVRWAGAFRPDYRLLPRYRNLPDVVEEVRVLLYRGSDTQSAIDEIVALGGRFGGVARLNNVYALAAFQMSAAALADVAAVPGVYSVQTVPTDGGLRSEMSSQVNVNNVDETNRAYPGYADWLDTVGFDGSGVVIANVDGGIENTHPDLISRILSCDGVSCGGSGSSSHGTHTAGIMAADGSSGVEDSGGFLRGMGVAPGANLVEQIYSGLYSQPGGMLLLMTDSYNNGASLSGNSWGPAGSPRGYDNDTMQVDIGVRDADPDAEGNQPLTFVLSFMNGYGGVSSQGTPDEAKNIFSIGSTKMRTSSGAQILEIDDLSNNSAHGPALDGRTIPHMVAPGCQVDSTVTGGSHGLKCGTSMASPQVSGAVAVFIEYYRSLPTYTVDPSPALIKAAFLPVAHDLSGRDDADGVTMGHPFDNKQGWGRMDLEAVVDPQVSVLYLDNPVVFDDTGETWTRTVSAFDPSKPIKIMLVWTDAPGHGLGGGTPAWNNDLDLIVESGGTVYHGNRFGSDGWSISGGVADFKNNTEGVFIGPTAPSSYDIRVLAANINSDAIPGVGDLTDQDFALVCYNCAQEPTFTLAATPDDISICAPDEADFSVQVGSLLGYDDPVTLSVTGNPAGTTTTFDANPAVPGSTVTLTIGDTAAAAAGTYDVDIQGEGSSGEDVKVTDVTLRVFTQEPGTAVLDLPADGATEVALVPTFAWTAAEQGVEYRLELATDAEFADIVWSVTTSGASATSGQTLESAATYFWRVVAENVCGAGSYSAARSFTTRDVPSVLLVDDDDNSPDVRSYYTSALDALGVDFDLWDTQNSDNEPVAATLSQYQMVIWFTGDEFGGAAGPGAAGETALAHYLDGGGCFFINSQDYHYDRGLTAFMTLHLGVSSINNDVDQASVTGAGEVFGGYGPYPLDFPFTNFSDAVFPNEAADVAMIGSVSNAGISKTTNVYRSMFWVVPFEAVQGAGNREALLSAMMDWCAAGGGCRSTAPCPETDVNCDHTTDGFDIAEIRNTSNWLKPASEAAEPRADVNGDGFVDGFDIAATRSTACWPQ
jgi:hypothetical protein